MKQNKYDDPVFFAKYSEMPRSSRGLQGAGEWPAFRSLLPDLRGKRVLDLGCGYGWHCRYAQEQGATVIVGVDISEKMLARAAEDNSYPEIGYLRSAIEDVAFKSGEFDVVISSLALHYVERFDLVCRTVYRWLKPGGVFVFSIEHPIFTARAAQDWWCSLEGERLHWPLDNYAEEGPRQTNWLGENVIKYHRTASTYVNTLIDAGFCLKKFLEPAPPSETITERPEWKDERRRPIFALIAAGKSDDCANHRAQPERHHMHDNKNKSAHRSQSPKQRQPREHRRKEK